MALCSSSALGASSDHGGEEAPVEAMQFEKGPSGLNRSPAELLTSQA